MEDSNESKKTNKEMENLSLQPNRFSRDLLQSFMGTEFDMEKEDPEEIELNLGLSLGGKFGVDKGKLIRSSSLAGSIPIIRDDDAVGPSQPGAYPSLVRTSSLPVETEEEWRKRKELQTLRRMAAKRRRLEKQRNLKADKDAGGGSGGAGGVFEFDKKEIEKSLRRKVDKEQLLSMRRFGSSLVVPPVGFSSQAGCSGRAKQGGSSGSTGQLSSQGSMESQGGSSSSLSELETKAFLGSSSCREVSNAGMQSLHELNKQEGVDSSVAKMQANLTKTSGSETENPSKGTIPEIAGKKEKEVGTNSMEDMPCVFTKGDGPNGRRIDGILYRYGKGEEVRIMCVCHGSFLSPAEFVKHAGGTGVTNPLKHIAVNPNSSSFC